MRDDTMGLLFLTVLIILGVAFTHFVVAPFLKGKEHAPCELTEN